MWIVSFKKVRHSWELARANGFWLIVGRVGYCVVVFVATTIQEVCICTRSWSVTQLICWVAKWPVCKSDKDVLKNGNIAKESSKTLSTAPCFRQAQQGQRIFTPCSWTLFYMGTMLALMKTIFELQNTLSPRKFKSRRSVCCWGRYLTLIQNLLGENFRDVVRVEGVLTCVFLMCSLAITAPSAFYEWRAHLYTHPCCVMRCWPEFWCCCEETWFLVQ